MDRQKKATNLVKNVKFNKKHSKITNLITLSIIILVLSVLCLFFNALKPVIVAWLKNDFDCVSVKDNLLVHFINVGQGDAISINLPDGKTAIIDAGPANASNVLVKYVQEKVLNNKHNNVVDYLVLTHADADHIGGAVGLLNAFDFKTIYMPIVESSSATYVNLTEAVEKENCNVVVNHNQIELDTDCLLKIFKPLDYTDTNNTCPLIKLEYMAKSFLFTGDLEAKGEKDYVNLLGEELDIDVLKVAHHGSKYSTCEEFLAATTPEYSVISRGNRYGHPNQETLDRLEAVNSNIVRTDEVGNVMFAVGENYNLDLLTGEYAVSGFIFDYRYIVLIIYTILVVEIIIIATKRRKVNTHN